MPEARMNFMVFYGNDLVPPEQIARGGREVSRFGKEGAWRAGQVGQYGKSSEGVI